MQKRLALLLPLLALAAPASAQSGFSVVGGLTSTSVSYEFEDGTEADGIASRTGFALGIGMERAAGGGLAFAPELLFAMKGFNVDGEDNYGKFSYLELPVLFRYDFATAGSATPFVMAGPTISYLLSCTVGDDDDSESCDDAFAEGESYEKLDYGVMLGAGVRFSRVGLSARYELGLANITEEACCTEKNKALMLLGSVSF